MPRSRKNWIVAGSVNALPTPNARNSPPNARCTWRRSLRLSHSLGPPRVSAIYPDEGIQDGTFAFWQSGEVRLHSLFQILQDEGHEHHVSNLVAGESVAHELRPKCAQVDHRRSGSKREKKAHHEVNHVIGRKNTKVANPRFKRDYPRDGVALLEIILVGGHATLGTPAGTRGIHNGGNIGRRAGNKRGFTGVLEIFPALCTVKSDIGRGFGD